MPWSIEITKQPRECVVDFKKVEVPDKKTAYDLKHEIEHYGGKALVLKVKCVRA